MNKKVIDWANNPQMLSDLFNYKNSRKHTWNEIADTMSAKYNLPFRGEQLRAIYRRYFSDSQKLKNKTENNPQNIYKERLITILNSGQYSIYELADTLDLAPWRIKELLQEMKQDGYNVFVREDNHHAFISKSPQPSQSFVHQYSDEGGWVRFGVFSDPHICSKYHYPEALATLYDIFEKEGIKQVYCAGNIVDGEKTYRGQEYEITHWGCEEQARQFCMQLPQKNNIKTAFICSSTCHEGYYYKSSGLIIGDVITNPQKDHHRPDLQYLGLDQADVHLKVGDHSITLRLFHPGGGSAYAHSYRPQKIVESYTNETSLPNILVIGHYHKMSYNRLRGVYTIQAGCLQHQTPFMQKRALEAHIGGWIIEFHVDSGGRINRFRQEDIRF